MRLEWVIEGSRWLRFYGFFCHRWWWLAVASCKLLGLVAETLLCQVWWQVAGVGCDPLDVVFFFSFLFCWWFDLQDVVFGGSDWQMLERNNKERLKK